MYASVILKNGETTEEKNCESKVEYLNNAIGGST